MHMRPLAVLALLAACGSASAQYSNAYFIGDSLTDSGSYAALVDPFKPGSGKFTTNPGSVWAEVLAAALGQEAVSAAAGGTNYAAGGARVASLPGYPASGITTNATPLSAQVDALLARSDRLDPRALYSVWGGANDLFAIADGLAAPDSLPGVAASLTDQVARLQAAGARYVVVFNLPDVGATPSAIASGPAGAAAASFLSNQYNTALATELQRRRLPVIPVHVDTLFAAVLADPGRYGFANTTGTACNVAALPGESSLLCTEADLVEADADQTYLFADGVHPTTATHELIGHYVEALVLAPHQISLLAEAPVETRRSLHASLRRQADAGEPLRSGGAVHVWAEANAGRLDYDRSNSSAGAQGDPFALTLGADFAPGDAWVLGLAAAYGNTEPEFGAGRGGFTQDEYALAAYLRYLRGPWRADLSVAWGELDYETARRIPLGASSTSVRGDAEGSNRSLALALGYEFTVGALRHGPSLGLTLQRVRVDSLRENNPLDAGLAYDDQERDSSLGSLGWRARLDAGRWQPYGEFALLREFEDAERDLRVRYLADTALAPVRFEVGQRDRSYANLALGTQLRLGQALFAQLGASADLGRDGGERYNLGLGLSAGF